MQHLLTLCDEKFLFHQLQYFKMTHMVHFMQNKETNKKKLYCHARGCCFFFFRSCLLKLSVHRKPCSSLWHHKGCWYSLAIICLHPCPPPPSTFSLVKNSSRLQQQAVNRGLTLFLCCCGCQTGWIIRSPVFYRPPTDSALFPSDSPQTWMSAASLSFCVSTGASTGPARSPASALLGTTCLRTAGPAKVKFTAGSDNTSGSADSTNVCLLSWGQFHWVNWTANICE